MLEAEVFDDVYHDIKRKLVNRGVPEEEIAFIHEANTELRKTELFGKVRSGQVRFLIGSTQKMGAGTNVQDRLVALHHLDVPWRPSDIEQQEGRILRQGNRNDTVSIFRYVTEGTFDSYSWQVIENKQKFISQIMTSKSPVRSCEESTCYRKSLYQGKDGPGYSGIQTETDESKPYQSDLPAGG